MGHATSDSKTTDILISKALNRVGCLVNHSSREHVLKSCLNELTTEQKDMHVLECIYCKQKWFIVPEDLLNLVGVYPLLRNLN